MNCPVCNAVMVDVTAPRITSGFIWQRYRCEPCKLTARVEITYSVDDPTPPTSCPDVSFPETK
jgi:transposase-like protein